MRKIDKIILHCSATPEGKNFRAKNIDEWHKQRGFSKIGYHYVIDIDGTVETGRPMIEIGAHCVKHNSGSIGICYIGGLDKDGKTPKDTRTEAQKKSLVELVKKLMREYNLKPNDIYGHYEFASKACPSFDMVQFRNELK